MKYTFQKMYWLLILVLLGGMIFSRTTFAAANSPEDVPPSHWAYRAVKLLIDKGYLQLYQDQTFQGDKPVDRYTMASIVSKLLIDSATGQTNINKDDVSLLKNLINEFRNELIVIIAKNNEQGRRLESLEKQVLITNDELTEVKAELQQLQDEAAQLKAQVDNLKTELSITKQRHTWYIIGAVVLGLIGAIK